jgi:hypothetical protein
MIYQHLNSPVVPPRDRNPEVPPLVSDLCAWMLVKDPAERPQNHDELRQAFDTVMGK